MWSPDRVESSCHVHQLRQERGRYYGKNPKVQRRSVRDGFSIRAFFVLDLTKDFKGGVADATDF